MTASPDTLALTRRVLGVLIGLNRLAGVLILVLLVASSVAPLAVFGALGVRNPETAGSLILGMRIIAVLGLVAIPVNEFVLGRLRAIVDSVGDGDPFILENAERLQKIAWAVLALSLLNLVISGVATGASSPGNALHIGWDFDVTRWLAVLLLFVLARVFETGARMREELEGTV